MADETPIDGVRKTQFAHPSLKAKIPPQPELTAEQATKYKAVLEATTSWTEIPNTSIPNAESSPITEHERMWLTRDCLLRYLRATKWVVDDATTRLRATLTWRREYGLARITPEYIGVESETGKQWQLGYDNAGRPCHYLNPHLQNTPRSDRQLEHLFFMLERDVDAMPPGQETLALLMNFGETRRGQGASFQQGKTVLSILQNHYPERLGRALLCNRTFSLSTVKPHACKVRSRDSIANRPRPSHLVPWHIWAFMKLVTPFIDPLTRQKLVFDEDMRLHVPPEQLRKSHGGDLEFEYEHDVYWPALMELTHGRREAQYERWVKAGKRVGEFEMYLKGGQETCLRDTLVAASGGDASVSEVTEKLGEVKVEEKRQDAATFAGDKGGQDGIIAVPSDGK